MKVTPLLKMMLQTGREWKISLEKEIHSGDVVLFSPLRGDIRIVWKLPATDCLCAVVYITRERVEISLIEIEKMYLHVFL